MSTTDSAVVAGHRIIHVVILLSIERLRCEKDPTSSSRCKSFKDLSEHTRPILLQVVLLSLGINEVWQF